MTARLTTNLVLGAVLSAVAAGCTVHTYSARPEYPSTAFTSHQPARHDVVYRTERRPRTTESYRADSYRPAQGDIRETRTRNRTTVTRNDTQAAEKPRTSSKPTSKPSSRPSTKPADSDRGEHVVLMPSTPDKTKPRTGRLLSFKERVEKLAERENQEVAKRDLARRKRMQAIGASASKRD